MSRLRVVNEDGLGFKTKIFIDDQDVSECFNKVSVDASLQGAVHVTLDAVVAELEFDGEYSVLHMPAQDTRELLIRHGWTPPPEEDVKVRTKSIRRNFSVEPLQEELFDPGVPKSGAELVDDLITKLKLDWVPGEYGDDTLSVARVYDERGNLVDNMRTYTLKVTLEKEPRSPRGDCE